MALKFHDNAAVLKGPLLAVILVVISFIVMVLYAREGESGPIHALQNTVAGIAAPIKTVSGVITSSGTAIGTSVEDLAADASTISGLRSQNEELRALVAQLEEYRQESGRLQELLDIRDRYELTTVVARVNSRSSDSWNNVVTLDKGSDEGIATGQPVLSGRGVIGQVISTTPHSSEVRLLTDQQSGLAVVVQSNRQEGILRGSFEGLLYLEDLPSDADVKVGDVIVTSGLGGGFFRGLVVGEVVSITERPGDVSPIIVVRPNADVNAFEEVIVATAIGNTSAADGSAVQDENAGGNAQDGSAIREDTSTQANGNTGE